MFTGKRKKQKRIGRERKKRRNYKVNGNNEMNPLNVNGIKLASRKMTRECISSLLSIDIIIIYRKLEA